MKSLQEIADFFAELGRPWVAVDRDGSVCSYIKEPAIASGVWYSGSNNIICSSSRTTYKGDWKDSLTKGTVPLKKGDKVRFKYLKDESWHLGYYIKEPNWVVREGHEFRITCEICEPYDWTESDLMPEWLKKEVEE